MFLKLRVAAAAVFLLLSINAQAQIAECSSANTITDPEPFIWTYHPVSANNPQAYYSGTMEISEATFVIAADLVRLSRSQLDAENTIACTMISEEFIGSIVTVFLEAADGTEFKVQLQERELATLDLVTEGSFYLSWPTASAHLLVGGKTK